MGENVYANGMAVAAKVGGGKVIAAFPDVCMSPPPPPAGPIPIPYPNSPFSKDLKQGSKTVKVGGKPIALKDSFYKTSPLGNEAATKSFGASVLSHQTSGKTQFVAYSFDVKVEGKNVCRHIDLTTSNHGSYPGSTPPFPDLESQTLASAAVDEDKMCACCGGDKHADADDAMHRDEYYEDHINGKFDHAEADKRSGLAKAGMSQAKIDEIVKTLNESRQDRLNEMKDLMKRSLARTGCTVCKNNAPVLPSPPCDVFYKKPVKIDAAEARQKTIESAWKKARKKEQAKPPALRPPQLKNMQPKQKVNHLTPKSAGGCPGAEGKAGNLAVDADLCPDCKRLEDEFTHLQKPTGIGPFKGE